jgi:hypothetical protein
MILHANRSDSKLNPCRFCAVLPEALDACSIKPVPRSNFSCLRPVRSLGGKRKIERPMRNRSATANKGDSPCAGAFAAPRKRALTATFDSWLRRLSHLCAGSDPATAMRCTQQKCGRAAIHQHSYFRVIRRQQQMATL